MFLCQTLKSQEPNDVVEYINGITGVYSNVPVGMLDLSIAINIRAPSKQIKELRDELFRKIESARINVAAIPQIKENLGVKDSTLKTLYLFKRILEKEFMTDAFLDSVLQTPKDIILHYDHVDSVSLEIKTASRKAHFSRRRFINHHKLRQARSGVHAVISRYNKLCNYFFESQRTYVEVWVILDEFCEAWRDKNISKMSIKKTELDSICKLNLGSINGLDLYMSDSTLRDSNVVSLRLIEVFVSDYIDDVILVQNMPDYIPSNQMKRYNELNANNEAAIKYLNTEVYPSFSRFGFWGTEFFRRHL